MGLVGPEKSPLAANLIWLPLGIVSRAELRRRAAASEDRVLVTVDFGQVPAVAVPAGEAPVAPDAAEIVDRGGEPAAEAPVVGCGRGQCRDCSRGVGDVVPPVDTGPGRSMRRYLA